MNPTVARDDDDDDDDGGSSSSPPSSLHYLAREYNNNNNNNSGILRPDVGNHANNDDDDYYEPLYHHHHPTMQSPLAAPDDEELHHFGATTTTTTTTTISNTVESVGPPTSSIRGEEGGSEQFRMLRRRIPSHGVDGRDDDAEVEELPQNQHDLRLFEERKRQRRRRQERWHRYVIYPRAALRQWYMAQRVLWTQMLERILPEWFTNVSVEDTSSHWQGWRWVENTWRALKRPLLVTLAVVLLLAVVWWMFLPAIAASLGVPLGGMGGNPNDLFRYRYYDQDQGQRLLGLASNGDRADQEGDSPPPSPWHHRVDSIGRSIWNPLPMHDLCYDRANNARNYANDVDFLVTEVIYWITGERVLRFPVPPDSENPYIYISVPDHQRGTVWEQLDRHNAIYPRPPTVLEPMPTALLEFSKRYASDEEFRKHATADDANDDLAKSTKHWIRRECQRHPPPRDFALDGAGAASDIYLNHVQPFIDQVHETGAFTVNVEGYIPAHPPTPPPSEEEHGGKSSAPSTGNSHIQSDPRMFHPKKQSDIIEEVIGMYNRDDDEADDSDNSAPRNPSEHGTTSAIAIDHDDGAGVAPTVEPPADPQQQQDQEGEKIKSLLPNTGVYERNVSAYELHAFLYHLAQQSEGFRKVVRSPENELEARIMKVILDMTNIYKEDHRVYSSGSIADAELNVISRKIAEEERNPFALFCFLRAILLWTGETGCVCAHHVGIPIPGVAWAEFDEKSGSAKKIRVLFYPRIPEYVFKYWEEHEFPEREEIARQNQLEETSSWLTWILPDHLVRPHLYGHNTDPGNRISKRDALLAQLHLDSEIIVTRFDPLYNYPTTFDLLDTPEHLYKIPYKSKAPWIWIEGLDYRGTRQRLRVSPTSLSCVWACADQCSQS
jgi:hypothetical protein